MDTHKFNTKSTNDFPKKLLQAAQSFRICVGEKTVLSGMRLGERLIAQSASGGLKMVAVFCAAHVRLLHSQTNSSTYNVAVSVVQV